MPDSVVDGLHHHWILRDDPVAVGSRIFEEGCNGETVSFIVERCVWGENVWPDQWGIWLELECDWVEAGLPITEADGLPGHWVTDPHPRRLWGRYEELGQSGELEAFIVTHVYPPNTITERWSAWLVTEANWLEYQRYRAGIPSRFEREWPV
jgi:hypothetical protein